MNKRLVWNFEIADKHPLDLASMPTEEPSSWRAEIRYFWDDKATIILDGLNNGFLNLALYKIKERKDLYYLLPNHNYNIKERRGELLFKPLMQDADGLQEFAKKINLSQYATKDMLPGLLPLRTGELLNLVNAESTKIYVEKTALIYKFATEPTIKLELARLTIADKCYFSACLEGHSKNLVTLINNHLFKTETASDYVHFLKKTGGLFK